jgi:hypothetical protein
LFVKLQSIPPSEKLWRSVYKKEQLRRDGTVKPSFFKDKRGLSCDLARFSTIELSRRGHQVPPAWPNEAGLVEFTVAAVRAVGSDVEHKPLRMPPDNMNNYSHCEFATPLEGNAASDLQHTLVVKPKP